MQKSISILLLICLITSYSCTNLGDTPTIEIVIPNLDLTKYTATDAAGQNIANPDESDWKFYDDWDATIIALFDGYDANFYSCAPYENLIVNPAFPNPCNGTFQISINNSDSLSYSLKIVNKFRKLLLATEPSLDENLSFDALDFAGEQDTFIRVYYLFQKDGCGYKGHGDIKIK